jgi:hypothetical protein
MVIAFASTVCLLGTGFVFIHGANYPRTRGPSKSLLFFGPIAKNSFNEFNQCWSRRTTEQHLEVHGHECRDLAPRFWRIRNSFRVSLTPQAVAGQSHHSGAVPWKEP